MFSKIVVLKIKIWKFETFKFQTKSLYPNLFLQNKISKFKFNYKNSNTNFKIIQNSILNLKQNLYT